MEADCGQNDRMHSVSNLTAQGCFVAPHSGCHCAELRIWMLAATQCVGWKCEGKQRWSRMISGGDRDNMFHSVLPSPPSPQQYANWGEWLQNRPSSGNTVKLSPVSRTRCALPYTRRRALKYLLFTYIFIRLVKCLFNDALSNSDYTASNGRIISEKWIGKDVQESGRELI
jgi:hypothetical protein